MTYRLLMLILPKNTSLHKNDISDVVEEAHVEHREQFQAVLDIFVMST
jgi:hypothetical protein